ncbi:12744_t:CDS:2, partial [Racocetra fulgida]
EPNHSSLKETPPNPNSPPYPKNPPPLLRPPSQSLNTRAREGSGGIGLGLKALRGPSTCGPPPVPQYPTWPGLKVSLLPLPLLRLVSGEAHSVKGPLRFRFYLATWGP